MTVAFSSAKTAGVVLRITFVVFLKCKDWGRFWEKRQEAFAMEAPARVQRLADGEIGTGKVQSEI